ncbi:MAG: DinB family protein [Flavobacteriaceae bacterium]|nr:DinB family protein [Flavobacteriaceae bacterium]
MNIKNTLLQEFKDEAAITKRFFANFPDDKIDYRPHEKSMNMQELANHVIEILGWPDFMLNSEKLDFEAGDYVPSAISTAADFQSKANELIQKSEEALQNTTEQVLEQDRWQMAMGDHILADWNKYGAIRHALNQLTHHRAQLGVYYRLNDLKVPGSYGPSADEQSF